MNKTFKAWCIKKGFTWFGHGKFSEHQYLLKVSFGENRSAYFTDAIDGYKPIAYLINNRHVVFFPIISARILNGVMSEGEYKKITTWIIDGINGNLNVFYID